MNPVQTISFDTTVASTQWFDAKTFEPGQPGVFEVNGVYIFDDVQPSRRFSYFNGRFFGPVASTTEAAFVMRFEDDSYLVHGITKFRGLVEQA